MTQETAIKPYEGQRPILMKSGLVHWVSEATAEKAADHLANQGAHGFLRITELGMTINTAEIEGVYTIEQYRELGYAKQGMWQCEYKNWHNKGKKECECKSEWIKKQREAEERKKQAEDNRPQTPEEIAASREAMTRMSEESVLKGSEMFISMYAKHNARGRMVRRSSIERWEKEHGPVDPKILERIAIQEDIEEAHKKEAIETL